jgi:site-specific recombinase XerD
MAHILIGTGSFSWDRQEIYAGRDPLPCLVEQEEHALLQLGTLTPIVLIGYRNELQHEQHKSISTINLRISALRTWCAWLVDQGYLPLDPAARVKLVSGEAGSKCEGLSSSQVNALLRQAQVSRDPARNYAIVQVFLQTGSRLSECSGLTFGDITRESRYSSFLLRRKNATCRRDGEREQTSIRGPFKTE